MNHALTAAAVAALFNLSAFAFARAAPVHPDTDAASQRLDIQRVAAQPKAANKQKTSSAKQTTNRFVAPNQRDPKRPLNPACRLGFKPSSSSNCNY